MLFELQTLPENLMTKQMICGCYLTSLILILTACFGADDVEPATATVAPPTEMATNTVVPTPVVSTATPSPHTPSEAVAPPVYDYEIVNVYPHNPDAFTQGLIYLDDILYEGTGLRGASTIRKVDLETGTVLQSANLNAVLFGEGITILGDKLYQLTWQARRGFVYDKNTFALEQEFTYPTEGWGLTHNGEHLIMSDGTANLYFLDPETLTEVSRVEVTDRGAAVPQLNELEYIDGLVYANIWRSDFIAMIDPQNGAVVGWVNLTNILGPEDRVQRVDVLNGIAYDAQGDRLFVTGKWWPKLFEIKLKQSEQ
ncbi:MAG: glutaminyl-peptide cyclotransferase [Chloroflexota bacterium]